MEESDLAIIGAGILGLTMASTYHQIHPEAKMTIIDAKPSLGGTWQAHRIFPGLRTNNLLEMFEHPDFPFDPVRFGVKEGQHIAAQKMLEYLEALIDWAGIRKFLRLHTEVESIMKDDQEWILQLNSNDKLKTKKLVFTNGTTHQASVPEHINRSPSFLPPVIHSRDFPWWFPSIARPDARTLVIGSGKSAFDICYAYATPEGSTVTILIRSDGNGPFICHQHA